VEVEIHGIDVFDPTTGQVRSGSADDVACWFVDEPYTRLAQALRNEIDEVAWERLFRTVSLPFPKRPTEGSL